MRWASCLRLRAGCLRGGVLIVRLCVLVVQTLKAWVKAVVDRQYHGEVDGWAELHICPSRQGPNACGAHTAWNLFCAAAGYAYLTVDSSELRHTLLQTCVDDQLRWPRPLTAAT